MRPTRLELAGFGSFREPTIVDLAGADLFVLVGPTGAGKSTIIDALVFALYGSVPRYGDRRLVAPVINQGRVEAKVRLDFVVDDVAYTAVRVVRRTATGATTKEARLESGARILAGNEKELTEQVERLTGLSFNHFTRCVVLPQGAFAEFLHAKPSERQSLLVELLGIDVYRRIGRRAREQAKIAADRVAHARKRLDGELAGATTEALDAAQRRVDTLAALQRRVAETQPELERLREEGGARRAAATDARARRALVDGLAVPAGATELSRRLHDAAQAQADAAAAFDKAEQQRQAAEESRAALPDSAIVAELQRLVAERDGCFAQLDPAARALEAAATAHRAAAQEHTQAQNAVAAARAALERARHDNLARTLSVGLSHGDPCPVCARPLENLVDHGDAGDLERAQHAHDAADRRLTACADAVQQAAAELVRRQAANDMAVTRHDELVTRVDGLLADHGSTQGSTQSLTLDDLPRVAASVAQADRELAAARDDERAARRALRSGEHAHQQLDGQRRQAWTQFDSARDRLATLSPPPVQRDDLAEAWTQLLEWAGERKPALQHAADDAQAAVEQVADQWRQLNGALIEACRAAEVPVERNDPLSACVAALERARAGHAAIARAIATAASLRAEAAEDAALADAAARLGQQLGANRFEQWLLNQALAQLVTDASTRLRELSSHAYSLEVDESGGFQVIDHHNADELRSARTLSGGETFLASLALALSLADHVAQLAAGTSARLDALLLDEGFGTLDSDTLDVVAAALEELGARGRTVGLVTHVRELAERMPVRFEVRRTAETSTVERLEQ
jgi:exonuclease SbcC